MYSRPPPRAVAPHLGRHRDHGSCGGRKARHRAVRRRGRSPVASLGSQVMVWLRWSPLVIAFAGPACSGSPTESQTGSADDDDDDDDDADDDDDDDDDDDGDTGTTDPSGDPDSGPGEDTTSASDPDTGGTTDE